jgi:translation initiation factor IF-3
MMNNNKKGPDGKAATHGFIINEKIRENEIRVINHDGENLGLMTKADALALVAGQSMDLVQISKDAQGIVAAKIMDLGKFIYEKKKQQNEAKKKTKTIEIKEIKMRPNIDVGDYDLKVSKIIEFISEGDHVKITLQFKGRELSLKNTLGPALFDRIINTVKDGTPNFLVDYQKETGVGSMWTRVLVGKKIK